MSIVHAVGGIYELDVAACAANQLAQFVGGGFVTRFGVGYVGLGPRQERFRFVGACLDAPSPLIKELYVVLAVAGAT